MASSLKVLVFIIGGLFFLIGLAGMFAPEDFVRGMGLSLESAEGAGTVRAMIGAHYVAMGGVCFFAVIRKMPVLLLPIAAIETVMVVARGLAALNGEFGVSTVMPTSIEVVAAIILATAAIKLADSNG